MTAKGDSAWRVGHLYGHIYTLPVAYQTTIKTIAPSVARQILFTKAEQLKSAVFVYIIVSAIHTDTQIYNEFIDLNFLPQPLHSQPQFSWIPDYYYLFFYWVRFVLATSIFLVHKFHAPCKNILIFCTTIFYHVFIFIASALVFHNGSNDALHMDFPLLNNEPI